VLDPVGLPLPLWNFSPRKKKSFHNKWERALFKCRVGTVDAEIFVGYLGLLNRSMTSADLDIFEVPKLVGWEVFNVIEQFHLKSQKIRLGSNNLVGIIEGFYRKGTSVFNFRDRPWPDLTFVPTKLRSLPIYSIAMIEVGKFFLTFNLVVLVHLFPTRTGADPLNTLNYWSKKGLKTKSPTLGIEVGGEILISVIRRPPSAAWAYSISFV